MNMLTMSMIRRYVNETRGRIKAKMPPSANRISMSIPGEES